MRRIVGNASHRGLAEFLADQTAGAEEAVAPVRAKESEVDMAQRIAGKGKATTPFGTVSESRVRIGRRGGSRQSSLD